MSFLTVFRPEETMTETVGPVLSLWTVNAELCKRTVDLLRDVVAESQRHCGRRCLFEEPCVGCSGFRM